MSNLRKEKSPVEDRFYTTAEVAQILHITHMHALELVRNGTLKGEKRKCATGNTTLGRWFVPESELRKYQRKDLDKYIKEKLKILKQLRIKLTPDQLEHMKSRNTEFEVDAFHHDIITGKTRIK